MAIIFQGAATFIIQINLSHYQFDNTLNAWLHGRCTLGTAVVCHIMECCYWDWAAPSHPQQQSILTACKKYDVGLAPTWGKRYLNKVQLGHRETRYMIVLSQQLCWWRPLYSILISLLMNVRLGPFLLELNQNRGWTEICWHSFYGLS